MKKFVLLITIGMVLSGPAGAAAADVAVVLEEQRQHGFSSPAEAIKQLTDAGADLAGAPQDLRMRYHATLAALYIGAEQPAQLKQELAQLERMAAAEKCLPCAHYKLVREAQLANRMQDVAAARALLLKLEPLSVAEPNLRQAIHYMRGMSYESMGNHARAIEETLQATQLAISARNPAEQVRALNLMMLSNIGRRDLPRAEALAKEAYALAERIGFVYMMAYIRGNMGWIYSLTGEHEKQLAALTEALNITRAHPGMSDSELINLVNLAEYHVGRKSYKVAAELASQAVALADKQKKPTAKGVVLMSLGQAQAGLGEPDKGIATMQQSIALLAAAGAKSYQIDATEALVRVYESAGRHREALATLHRFIELKQESTLREREKAISESQEKFSAQRKDHEIVRLSLENAKREAEVTARGWQQGLWATAALALALGGALLIQLVSRTRARNRLLEDSNAELSDQSVHDPLTGVFNRRHCVALMEQQAALNASRSRDRSYGACVGLMLLDVDHFKLINDTFGHSAGDIVLVEIARRLQALVRQHDVVVRWGGEEFVLVLPGTAAEGMTVLAERALKLIGSEPVIVEGKPVAVTVSLGCASYPLLPGLPWQDTLKVADLAMYLAKQRGRNRAVCLMDVASEAPADLLLNDLAAAEAAGHVSLRSIEGPVAPYV
ncbi:MAG: diguanylate cyclase [Pseudomonadota bacterium]